MNSITCETLKTADGRWEQGTILNFSGVAHAAASKTLIKASGLFKKKKKDIKVEEGLVEKRKEKWTSRSGRGIKEGNVS